MGMRIRPASLPAVRRPLPLPVPVRTAVDLRDFLFGGGE